MSEEKNENERPTKIKFANGTKPHNGSSDPMYNLKRNKSPVLESTLPAKFIKSAANLNSAHKRGKEMETAAKYGNDLTQAQSAELHQRYRAPLPSQSPTFINPPSPKVNLPKNNYQNLTLKKYQNFSKTVDGLKMQNFSDEKIGVIIRLMDHIWTEDEILVIIESMRNWDKKISDIKSTAEYIQAKLMKWREENNAKKKANNAKHSLGGKSTKRTRKHKSKRRHSRRK